MRKYQYYLLYLLFIIFGILITFVIVYLSLATFIAQQAEIDTASKADAIVVLGARSYIEGKYNPCLTARVKHAVALYKKGSATNVLLSGGADKEDEVNEAESMKKMAIGLGVPSHTILLETSSTSTYENLLNSQKIINAMHLHSIILVTEPFHIARASLVAKKLGYNFSVSPAKESPCWIPNKYLSKYFLKEPLAILLYKLQNKL